MERLKATAEIYRKRSAFVWAAVVCVVLIDMMVGGMAVRSLQESRRNRMEQAEVTSQNLAKVLEQYLSGAIREIDLALQSVVDDAERQMAEKGRLDLPALTPTMARQHSRLPAVISLRAADAKGRVLQESGAPPVDVSDRDYYQLAQSEHGLIVGRPILSRISHRWVLPLARRLSNPDGSFAGVVYANLSIEHLNSVFSRLNIGTKGIVIFYDRDRNVVTRYPEPSGPGSAPTYRLSAPPLVALMEAGEPVGTYHTTSPIDGVDRVFSYRKLPELPYYVNVALPDEEIFGRWWEQARETLLLLAAFVLLTGFFLVLLWRAWHQQLGAFRDMEAAKADMGDLLVRLSQSEARFRMLFNSGNDAILVYRVDPATGRPLGGFAEINDVACRRLGYDRETLLALSPEDIEDQNAPRDPEDMTRLLKAGAAVFERMHVARDGSRLPVEINARLFELQGETMVLAMVRDIGDRKALEEELRRSNAELEQFAYVASHDLRSPLRTVCSYLQLIERRYGDKLEEEGREFLAFAVDGGRRMDRLILDLLEYSRVGRGAESLPVALAAAVAEAADNLKAPLEEAGAELVVAGGLPVIMGSPTELTRLFQNLIGNAVKYRAEGRRPRIAVSLRPAPGCCTVVVEDNGIGIEPKEFENIFGIFQRLQPGREQEGTGIGLAVCRKIAQRHGGRIWVESEPGKGSRFCVSFPACVEPAAGESTPDDPAYSGAALAK